MRYKFFIHRSETADVELFLSEDALIRIEDVKDRPVDPALEEMARNIRAKTAIGTSLNKLTWFRELQEAVGTSRVLRLLLDAAQQRLNEARRELAQTRTIHYPVLLITALAVAVGSFVEVGLTWAVLPPFLNVPAYSLLGFTMGGLTLVLTIAVEQVLNPPIQMLERGLAGPTGRSWRLFALSSAGILIASIMTANIIVLVKLGMAREEATKLLQLLMDMTQNEVPHLDPSFSTSLVVWVSCVTVLDSALLLHICIREFNNCSLRWATKRRITKSESEFMRLQHELMAADTKERCKRMLYDDAERHARELADASESHDRALLEEIRARQTPDTKIGLATAVDELLQPRRLSGTPESLLLPCPKVRMNRVQ